MGDCKLCKTNKPITKICLNVTDDCCLACRYCFVQQKPNYMTYETAKFATDWIISNGKDNYISFFGGEPLLCWDSIVKPLTLYIREELQLNSEEFGLSITTNGILLDEDKLKFMKQYEIYPLLSMDGAKDTQDFNRPCKNNASSFDILDKKLDLILQYFPDITFRGTIIPETCNYFSDNLEYAANKGVKNTFFIIDASADWAEESRKILETEVRKYSNYLVNCFINDEPIIRQRTFEQGLIKVVKNNILACQGGKRKNFSLEQSPCGSGQGFASIAWNGDIYSCQEVPTRDEEKSIFYLGNIFTGIEEGRQLNLLSQLKNKQDIFNHTDKEKCKSCLIEGSCNTSSCMINNYLYTGSLYTQTDAACWWDNLMAKEAIYVCNFLGSLKNYAFEDYFKFVLTSEGGCL